MLDIIIGNICSLGAMLSDSFGGTRKTAKGILLVQCISQFFYAAASIILKGYSATVQNVVAVFRNIYAVYGKHNKIIEWWLVVLPVILGFTFNNRGLLGVLPIIANFQFSLVVIYCKDPVSLKWSLVAVNLMFAIFNFAILNFVSGISNIVTTVVTTVSIIRGIKGDGSR